MEPCPPNWEGYWTDCSVTCGEGVQQYVLQCKQESASGAIILSDAQCPNPKPSSQTRPCQEAACEIRDNELPQSVDNSRLNREWSVGPWSEVSTIFILKSCKKLALSNIYSVPCLVALATEKGK